MNENENRHVHRRRRRQRRRVAPAAIDTATQLEKLEGMLQRGTLTREEFEAEKRRLSAAAPAAGRAAPAPARCGSLASSPRSPRRCWRGASPRWRSPGSASSPGFPTVGGTKDPDVAAIVALAPDLVVVNDEENRREDADALRAAGLALHVTTVRSVADVAPCLTALAAAVGLAAADPTAA